MRILVVILLLAVVVSACQDAKYKTVQLRIYGLVLPEKTDKDTEVVARFIWGGGNFAPLPQTRMRPCA